MVHELKVLYKPKFLKSHISNQCVLGRVCSLSRERRGKQCTSLRTKSLEERETSDKLLVSHEIFVRLFCTVFIMNVFHLSSKQFQKNKIKYSCINDICQRNTVYNSILILPIASILSYSHLLISIAVRGRGQRLEGSPL